MIKGQKYFELLHDLHDLALLLGFDTFTCDLPKRFCIDSKVHSCEAATSKTMGRYDIFTNLLQIILIARRNVKR